MTAARTGAAESVARALSYGGAGLLVAVTVLLVLLATLPGRQPFLATTVSSNAYGSHGGLVFSALLLFGLATAMFALALGLRLRGAAGVTCGLLVAVWAGAAVFDAFVPTTSRHHLGTAFGQVHTMIAVAGIVAQVIAALVYLRVVRRRLGRVSAQQLAVTGFVLAGAAFMALHPNSLAGLSERLLFAASAIWMLTSAWTAPPRASRTERARHCRRHAHLADDVDLSRVS
ncbi:MAG TPA: DUF998 domain-containing protein [Mycobacteriales bacterium]